MAKNGVFDTIEGVFEFLKRRVVDTRNVNLLSFRYHLSHEIGGE